MSDRITVPAYRHAYAELIRDCAGRQPFDPHSRYTIKAVQHRGFCSMLELDGGEKYFKCHKPAAIGCFCAEHSREWDVRRHHKPERSRDGRCGRGTRGRRGEARASRSESPPSPPPTFSHSRSSSVSSTPPSSPPRTTRPEQPRKSRTVAARAHDEMWKRLERELVPSDHSRSASFAGSTSLWALERKDEALPPLRTADFAIGDDGMQNLCGYCHERSMNAMLLPCTHMSCMFCVHQRSETGVLLCVECGLQPDKVLRL